jgi:hypothetical protein
MITPTNTLLARLQTLLQTDTGSIASATLACKVHLAIAAFTPSVTLTIANLTEATFTGYAALVGGTGNQQAFFDPVTGQRQVQLLEPAGGWHWQASGTTGLPMTVYGWYVTDNGVANLYGSALFPTPITLTNIGDAVDVPNIRFAIPTNAIQ